MRSGTSPGESQGTGPRNDDPLSPELDFDARLSPRGQQACTKATIFLYKYRFLLLFSVCFLMAVVASSDS